MPTTEQLLKAKGHLPRVCIADIHNAAVDISEIAHVLEGCNCDHPDKYDAEIADATDPNKLAHELGIKSEDAEFLIEAHRRMGEYATGFSRGCNPEFPDSHSVSFFLDRATFPEHYTRPVRDDELDEALSAGVWRWTREELFDLWAGKPMLDVAYLGFIYEAYRVLGCAHVERDVRTDAQVEITSPNMPGSVIGRAWYTSGRCNERGLRQHIDSLYRPDLIGTCKLGAHEWGHNHGEEHQFAGQSGNNGHHSVMSYSPPRLFYGFSTGQKPHVLPRDRSIDSLIRKYGGRPNPPYETKPVEPVPPKPQPPIVVGVGTITMSTDVKAGTYSLVKQVTGTDGPIIHG